jgi:hypothetical protein
VFSGVFIAGKVDEVGATTMGDVLVHLEASLNISLRSAWFTNESFSWKRAELPVYGLLSSSAGLSEDWFKEFCYISTQDFILFVSNCGVGDWFLTHSLSLGMRDFHFPGTEDCGHS